MANTLNTLYPPMIETFMPAFIYDQPAPITFSYSPYNSKTDIRKIHVSIVNQKTNKSVLKTTYVPENNNDTTTIGKVLDHIWIFDIKKLNGSTQFKIPTSILKTKSFEPNTFYKVQLRFDSSSDDPKNTNYLISQRFNFSEWSSVCLIKAIEKVYIQMQGTNDSNNVQSNYIETVQPGIIPVAGYLTTKNNIVKERLQKYKVQIISQDQDVIDESGWIYTGNKQDDNSIYWLADLTNASPDAFYTVRIDAVTKNQYELPSKEYQLKISNYDPIKDFEPIWTFKSVVLNSSGNQQTEEERQSGKDKKIVTEEDGEISFTITTNKKLPSGFLYVKRASSLDNFKKWELISCTKHGPIELKQEIKDSTVGSLIKYRYACQYRLAQRDIFTTTKFSSFVYPKFYDILLYRQGKQIAIRYNEQIASYSSVVNRQIINTLGGKYPKFAENANMNYKKLTISGLLSVETDFNRKFINDRDYAMEMNDYDKYMDGIYEIRNDTIADGDIAYETVSQITTSATYNATHTNWESDDKKLPATLHDLFPKDNWWLEREFREQALTWLNDGEPKLLRSMTEGNLAVILTDISLTPNNQVGRRTYNINMTAYEIGDGYSLDTLSTLGIITIPNEYEEYKNSEMSVEQDEELVEVISTIGQIYSKQTDTNPKLNLVKLDFDQFDEYNINEYSLIDLAHCFYNGVWSEYMPENFELKDVKITFESKPQWYSADLSGPITDFSNPINNKGYILGYRIGIKTKGLLSEQEQIIFVNEKGYYQVPSNIIVTQIILYDNAKATIDYKLSYSRIWNETSIPSKAEVAQKIVGQISGKYFADQALSENIKNKYEYYKYNTEVDNNTKIILQEHWFLDTITGVGFDGTPYTILNIQFIDEEKYKSFLVGQTGVYNLMTDYPIKEISCAGRQMFRKDTQQNLREWEFFIDNSAIANYDPSENYIAYWYKNGFQKTDKEVKIDENISPSQYIYEWGKKQYIPARDGYKTIEEIEPKFNTVYGFQTNDKQNLNKNYKIYYIDGKWYDVDYDAENPELILAKVPVYGIINYKGNLVQTEYN